MSKPKEIQNHAEQAASAHLSKALDASAHYPGLEAAQPRTIETVAIIGAGTMGAGIAMCFASAGIPVTLLEQKEAALERGLANIRSNYERSVVKGKLCEAQKQASIALITGSLSYQDLSNCDLVIEAVFENIEIKRSVFRELDKICKPGAILATNTSYLDVNDIASQTRRPEDVIGLHFFSPANIMRLLEIVNADNTSEEVLLTTLELAKRIQKVPVVSGVCWGFIGNRMFEPYGREASRLVLEGASPAQVDAALKNYGFAMGFLSVIDLAGIDIGFFAREGIREQLEHDPSYQIICDKLYHLGRYGQKTGRGFYFYKGREQTEDLEVIALAKSTAEDLGITQRDISDQEIVERCLLAMINEGLKILEEGVACRSSDIDLVSVNGYGFPADKGGPMFYAEQLGLTHIAARMRYYKETLGDYGSMWFQPAKALEKTLVIDEP